MDRMYQKSTLETCNTELQSLEEEVGVANLGNNIVNTGCAIRHTEGSNQFKIVKPGLYQISVDAVGKNTPATLAPVTLQLYKDDKPMVSAFDTKDVEVDKITSFHFTTLTIVNTCPFNPAATFKLVNADGPFDYTMVSVTVIKLA